MVALRRPLPHGCLVALACALLAVATAGCSDDDDAESGSGFPEAPLTVALSSVPPDAGATAFVMANTCFGDLCETAASASGDARSGSVIGLDPGDASFDLLVFVPDDPAWSLGEPMGAGYYAAAESLSTAAVSALWVSAWEFRTSADAVSGGTTAPATGSARLARLSGTLADAGGVPIADATVWVERQALSVTDVDGAFVLEPLPSGPVTIRYAPAGFAEGNVETSVAIGDNPVLALPALAASTDGPAMLEGIVTDGSTGEPVDAVRVQAGGGETTTDEVGRFELEVPTGTFHARLTREGYARLDAGLLSCDAEADGALRFTIDPLQPNLIGTWEYCYSQDANGERFDAVVAGTDEPNDIVKQVWAFGDDGLFDSSAWGARALGTADRTPWNGIETAGRVNLVRALDSPWCEPFYASEVSPYWWFDEVGEANDDDELVYVRSYQGERRHHYVENAASNPECTAAPPTGVPCDNDLDCADPACLTAPACDGYGELVLDDGGDTTDRRTHPVAAEAFRNGDDVELLLGVGGHSADFFIPATAHADGCVPGAGCTVLVQVSGSAVAATGGDLADDPDGNICPGFAIDYSVEQLDGYSIATLAFRAGRGMHRDGCASPSSEVLGQGTLRFLD